MRLVLDKIEKKENGERIFVFEGNNSSYCITENKIPKDIIHSLKVGLILEADIRNEELCSPKILIDETNKKTEEMKSRLTSLFNRKKQGS